MKDGRALLSPEGELVLRARRDASRLDDYSCLLQQPLEWQRLLQFAERERAALPLWRELRQAGLDEAPGGPRALKRMAQLWEFKLLHLERLLGRLLREFDAAGIEAVLLKGAAAAASVYDGFAQRPMLDVDLLVPPEQAEPAWQLAQELGWRWDAERYPRESYEEAHHLPPLYDSFGASCGLEIHTRLWMPDHPFRLTERDVRRAAVPATVAGVRCLVPSVDHQLLHCCIHFAWSHKLGSHGWRAFSDVGALLGSGGLDWDSFVMLAQHTRAQTCCYWTLRLAARVTGVEVPDEVLRRLRPRGPGYLLDVLERNYLMNLLPDGVTNSPSIGLTRHLWQVGIQRGRGSIGIDLPDAPDPMRFSERVVHHAKQFSAWARYIRSVA